MVSFGTLSILKHSFASGVDVSKGVLLRGRQRFTPNTAGLV